MDRPACLAILTIVGLAVSGPAHDALAAPYDGNPKILLHRMSVASKNLCARGQLADCASAVTAGSVGPGSFVYLLAARGSLASVASVEVGLDYQGGVVTGRADHQAIDIFGWTKCATLEFPTPGAAAWPGPGSGNLVVWDAVAACQTGATAVAGYFYVAAYSADELRLITRPASGIATVTTCDAVETPIAAASLGSARFSASGTESGCNPCLAPCADAAPICRLSTSSLDFGTNFVGIGDIPKLFTVTNDGGGMLTGRFVVNSAHYRIWGDLDFSLAAYQSVTVSVVFAPPGTPGDYPATLELGTDCGSVALSGRAILRPVCRVFPSNVDFAHVTLGETRQQRIMILNDGPVAFGGQVGPGSGAFTIVGDRVYQLAPGESDSVIVQFTPVSLGSQAAVIPVGGECREISVSGIGGERPPDSCGVVPTILDFGPVSVGHSAGRPVAVTNYATGCIEIRAHIPCTAFHPDGPFSETLCAQGRPRDIWFNFTPSQLGQFECLATFVGTGCPGVLLRGEGRLPGSGVFSPPLVDFGTIPPNSVVVRTITLTNAGTTPINGTLAGGCNVFRVLDDPAFALAPGESREYRIRFQPPQAGSYQCYFDGGTAVDPLRLQGVADGAVPIRPTTWSAIKSRASD